MKNNHCIENLLKYIDLLQNNSLNRCDNRLGLSISTYNTRVISLYKRDGSLFIFNNSSLFRIMDIRDNRVLILLLNYDNGIYSSTNQFITIDISSISCIRCIEDTYISL